MVFTPTDILLLEKLLKKIKLILKMQNIIKKNYLISL